MRGHLAGRRHLLWVVVALGVLEIAWLVTLPPFRGSDEVDHAFRADAVAAGQWRATEIPEDGRGLLVEVSADVVEAARPECLSHASSGADSCVGTPVVDRPGRTSVASGAANYQPFYYWYIGTASRPFDGVDALYAMRIASALLCVLLLAVGAMRAATAGPWTLLGLWLGCVPTMAYSMSVAAPNGPEMAAAVAWWLGLLTWSPTGRERGRDAAVLGAVGAALCFLRLLGPVFLLLSLVVVLVARGSTGTLIQAPSPSRERRLLLVVSGVAGAGLLAGAGWVLTVRSYAGPREPEGNFELGVEHLVLWVMQSIGAFPYRNQMAPLVVYVLAGTALTAVVIIAVRRSAGRVRAALVLAVLLSMTLPIALTLATMEGRGNIWQGRYGWPLAVGIVLLACWILDRAETPAPRAVLTAVVVALAAAHVVGMLNVLADERSRDVGDLVAGWTGPPALLIVTLGALSAACFARGLDLRRRRA